MGNFEIGERVSLRSTSAYVELKEGDLGQIISISPIGWVTVDFERDGGVYTVYYHHVAAYSDKEDL